MRATAISVLILLGVIYTLLTFDRKEWNTFESFFWLLYNVSTLVAYATGVYYFRTHTISGHAATLCRQTPHLREKVRNTALCTYGVSIFFFVAYFAFAFPWWLLPSPDPQRCPKLPGSPWRSLDIAWCYGFNIALDLVGIAVHLSLSWVIMGWRFVTEYCVGQLLESYRTFQGNVEEAVAEHQRVGQVLTAELSKLELWFASHLVFWLFASLMLFLDALRSEAHRPALPPLSIVCLMSFAMLTFLLPLGGAAGIHNQLQRSLRLQLNVLVCSDNSSMANRSSRELVLSYLHQCEARGYGLSIFGIMIRPKSATFAGIISILGVLMKSWSS